jgi:hypothetical protein
MTKSALILTKNSQSNSRLDAFLMKVRRFSSNQCNPADHLGNYQFRTPFANMTGSEALSSYPSGRFRCNQSEFHFDNNRCRPRWSVFDLVPEMKADMAWILTVDHIGRSVEPEAA